MEEGDGPEDRLDEFVARATLPQRAAYFAKPNLPAGSIRVDPIIRHWNNKSLLRLSMHQNGTPLTSTRVAAGAFGFFLAVVRSQISSTPSADGASAAPLDVLQKLHQLGSGRWAAFPNGRKANRLRACRDNRRATGERRERELMR